MQAPDYPSAPWRLRGDALVVTRMVREAVARRFVPKDLRIACIAPGMTLGIVAFVRYGEGSTLQYHELMVAPALVRVGWRMGAWISHIYVDSEMSLRGGREIWGVPKQLASFEWSPTRIGIRHELVHAGASIEATRRPRWGVPIAGPLFGSTPHSWRWAAARGTTALQRVRVSIQLGGDDLESLAFERASAAWRLTRFEMQLAAPRGVMPR